MIVATSVTTKSTHLKAGSISLEICFLTIASNAMSGVKSPFLFYLEKISVLSLTLKRLNF